MIIQGQPADAEVLRIQKSIAENLRNRDAFQSETKEVAENGVELKPPIPMKDCLYVFENSSHVAKCCRILSADIIYNEITLTLDTMDEPSENEVNQVQKINKYLINNIDELYYLSIDYHYAGWAALEYTWDNTNFKLKQIPIHTCKIIRDNIHGMDVYILKQQINSKTHYFKIMGEEYPENSAYYNGEKLGYACLLGGDNIYQFFSLPKWAQDYNEILTEIAISANDYRTVSKGNISSGVLNINLEPQLPQPIKYDDNGNPIIQKAREDVIREELQSANTGTAVIFTESNRPLNMDYVNLTNSNHSYLSDLGDKCQQSVLNDYNIPLIRMMINTDKESMHSDKTKSLWEIYTLNLKNEQKPFKQFIRELIKDLYGIPVEVNISTPIFSDRREIEVRLISQAWNDGILTLKQTITGLSDYIDVIDLTEYDFTVNQDIWSYRKLPELTQVLSDEDLATIEAIEAQLREV